MPRLPTPSSLPPNQTPTPSPAENGSTNSADETNSPGSEPIAQQTTADLLNMNQGGTNYVFVLDRSASMGSNGVFLAARQELVTALQSLGTNKNFYIELSPYKAMPAAPTFLLATETNIDSITNWIFSTRNSPEAFDPAAAMQQALKFKPDTICLFSDGGFSTNQLPAIRNNNDTVHASINTVNFFNPNGEAVLRQIANENNGTYRFVPSPGAGQNTNAAPEKFSPATGTP
jgi:hypothetical protein